ncbi:DUF2786 domain-containing protein [Corynebacterium sp. A21]|uniref:DUF2786 domain-containing protein n=1 Tax=Corynebacterium sp. A21 TaxID=3457318 RepID=UPI003FD446DD
MYTDTTENWQNYTLELHREIAEGLVAAARKGWTPDDLRHVLGSRIDHLLFLVLHRINDTVPEATRTAWLRQCHPTEEIAHSTASLEECRDLLREVGPLRDHPLLGDPHGVEESDRAFAQLSPEQRKAHHRVIALLKKAESTNFEGEADALVAKAQQLRQRYRIESLLAEVPGEGPDLQAQRLYLHAPWIKHQYSLLAGVARVNGCASMLLTTNGICTILGTADDLRYVTDLFGSLNRQRGHFMRTSPGAHEAAARGETSAYRRSFMIAYSSHTVKLLTEASRQASDGTTLPVLVGRGLEAHRTLAKLFPHSRSLQLSSRHSGGYRDGISAAHRSHLNGDSNGIQPMSA